MSSISVIPVSTKAQQKAFVKFVWEHYKGDPNWVPPITHNIKQLLNYSKHPFYEAAECQTFLAKKGDQVVGRIAAIIDHNHNQHHNEQRGMFGFFESTDDQEVANALFDAAKEWFAAKDIFLLRGPANPSQNYEWGMLVEGFDSPPTFLMTYNKPYYDKLVKGYGFEKAQDLYAYNAPIPMLETIDPKLAFVAEEATKRFKINVRPVSTGKKFNDDVGIFLKLYNSALQAQWGFTPMSQSELAATASNLKFLIAPEMTSVAEVDGEGVGICFGLLDYNPLVKQINGKLYPFGWIRMWLGKKKLKRVRLMSTNVAPEYQRWGLGIVLMARMVPSVKDWGIDEGEFSWVLESNKLSRGTIERGGLSPDKTFRIYDYTPS
jgi:GNAT superfamily N-acetyltransferase